MCYTIPGKVIDIKQGFAVIDYFGEPRKARNDFFDLSCGDYVYAQGGFVVQKVSMEDALSSMEAWRELFFELKKIDNRLSRVDRPGEKVGTKVKRILNKAQNGLPVSRDEALVLLDITDEAEKGLLFRTANSVRQKVLSNACCVHGIIEFSNFCRNDCLYCGIRKSNNEISRYRMAPDEILASVKEAVDLGFKALVLQSGEDYHYTTEIIEGLVTKIRKEFPVLIFLSVGERDAGFYRRMFDAGARGVLLRFESSNRKIYSDMKPGNSFNDRVDHLSFLSKLGFLIATGGLLGLPGQTRQDMIEDIFLAKSFGTEMYSFGPFIPHSNTPLKDQKIISSDEAIKFIAVARLIVPDGKILVTTALETIDRGMRRLGLLSGANSFMLNVTPVKYRKQYEIYQGRAGIEEELKIQIEEALALLKELGRAPTDLGVS